MREMTTSKSGLRTFQRKRKETAADKYDQIFGSNQPSLGQLKEGVSKNDELEVKRRKCNFSEEIQESEATSKSPIETAAKKFDALFGTKEKYSHSQSQMPDNSTLCSMRSTDEPQNGNQKDGGNKSKYDLLYERNEKRASDRFDAIFTESTHKPKSSSTTKRFRQQLPTTTKTQTQDSEDVFSFPDWEEKTEPENPDSEGSSETSSQKSAASPTKLPNITHASMMKVGGRVVLNIQRGGNKNSLVEKGGIVLLSPKSESASILKETKGFNATSSELKNEYKKKNKVAQSTTQSHYVDFLDQEELLGGNIKSSVKQGGNSSHTTRTRTTNSFMKKSAKPNASYNPRPWASNINPFQQNKEVNTSSLSQPSSSQGSVKETVAKDATKLTEVPTLKRAVTWPKNVGESIVTSLKCQKEHVDFFTVVRRVKNYQNVLEEGEIQEFEDEVIYLQEGLSKNQPVSVRCLSVTSLACKCVQQNFRLYLRAHNILMEIFESLEDADENEALSLATATLLFMLSRDRQIEIDKPTLRILLKLVDPLEKRTTQKSQPEKRPVKKTKFTLFKESSSITKEDSKEEIESVLSKVRPLIDCCGDPLVTSDDLSVKTLASEALLRFTARRTSEWFREEIRLKGGLDHIIGLVKENVDTIEHLPSQLDYTTPLAIERPLCVLERLLRVLENGIVNSARNAMYLVTHQRALLLKRLSVLITRCGKWLHQTTDSNSSETSPPSAKSTASLLLKNVIAQIIKLLVNISNDNEWSSTRIGEQDGLLKSILMCILHIPDHVNENHRYEIVLLSLGLLVNLVESSASNRMTLMKMRTHSIHQMQSNEEESDQESILAVEALVELFIEREATARQNEILGEEGVKRAAEAKRLERAGAGDASSHPVPAQHPVALGDADSEGYWLENDEGMEWVAVESRKIANGDKDDDLELMSSQGSQKSIGDPRSLEAKLTEEEKNEMKQALEKASDHMEASIVASYSALVLGCLIHGSRSNSKIIRERLPNDGDLNPMIKMLKKFLTFMRLTHGMSKKGEVKLSQIIEDMEEVNLEKSVS